MFHKLLEYAFHASVPPPSREREALGGTLPFRLRLASPVTVGETQLTVSHQTRPSAGNAIHFLNKPGLPTQGKLEQLRRNMLEVGRSAYVLRNYSRITL